MTGEVETVAQIPAIKPPSSPQELREWMVEDYTRMHIGYGGPTDRRDVERRVLSDLAITDAVAREARHAPPPPKPDPAEVRAERRGGLDQKAAEVGATIDHGQLTVKRQPVAIAHAASLPTDRWSFAKGRLARIMSGATNHPDPKIATSTCEVPALALRAYKLFAQFATARYLPRQRDEANPFFGLSVIDRGRLLQRLVEDICDASTGRLGPWLVPK